MRRYLVECVMLSGTHKGTVFTMGNPDAPMTHDEAVCFLNAHTNHPFRRLRLTEVQHGNL